MASISTTLELTDKISTPLENIVSKFGGLMNVFENIDKGIDENSISRFSKTLESVSNATSTMGDEISENANRQAYFNNMLESGRESVYKIQEDLKGISNEYGNILNNSDTLTNAFNGLDVNEIELKVNKLSVVSDDVDVKDATYGFNKDNIENSIKIDGINNDSGSYIDKIINKFDYLLNNTDSVLKSFEDNISNKFLDNDNLDKDKIGVDNIVNSLENAFNKVVDSFKGISQDIEKEVKNFGAVSVMNNTEDVSKNIGIEDFNIDNSNNINSIKKDLSDFQEDLNIVSILGDGILGSIKKIGNSIGGLYSKLIGDVVDGGEEAMETLEEVTTSVNNGSERAFGFLQSFDVGSSFDGLSESVVMLLGVGSLLEEFLLDTNSNISNLNGSTLILVQNNYNLCNSFGLVSQFMELVSQGVLNIIEFIWEAILKVYEWAKATIFNMENISNAINTACEYISNIFLALINFVITLFINLWNLVASFVNFLGNVFNSPIMAIANLFRDLFDFVLGVILSIAKAIDTVFGSNLSSAVSSFKNKIQDFTVGMTTDQKVYMEKLNPDDFIIGSPSFESDLNLSDRYSGFSEDTHYFYNGVEDVVIEDIKGLSDIDLGNSLGSDVGDIAMNSGEIADTVSVSSEDLKYIRDLAEQEVVNRFTTAEISVSLGGVTNNVNSNMDLDGIVDYLTVSIEEAMEISAEGVH